MSEWYESAVAIYLTRRPGVFIVPQYIVEWNSTLQEGGSAPDFVALDFNSKEVIIIEVSASTNLKHLSSRLMARERNWYLPIARDLLRCAAITPQWRIRSLAFVGKDDPSYIKDLGLANEADVTLTSLEPCLRLWEYRYRRNNNKLSGEGRGVPLPEGLGPIP